MANPTVPGWWIGAMVLTYAVALGCLRGGSDRVWAEEQSAGERSAAEQSDGRRLLQARCAVCHSLDLVTQQRLNRARWEATVTKMAHWGAQLSPEEQHVLTEYLAGRFHPEAPDVLAEAEVAVQAQAAGSPPPPTGSRVAGEPRRGASLYGQNCLPCHGPEASGGMGPKLAQNPILKDARRFNSTVREGRGAMPAWSGTLADRDISDIHAWLKSLQ
jgi:cytochrome c oxidase cbb3-type subunit 3